MVDAVLPNVLNNFSTTRELHMQSGNNERVVLWWLVEVKHKQL